MNSAHRDRVFNGNYAEELARAGLPPESRRFEGVSTSRADYSPQVPCNTVAQRYSRKEVHHQQDKYCGVAGITQSYLGSGTLQHSALAAGVTGYRRLDLGKAYACEGKDMLAHPMTAHGRCTPASFASLNQLAFGLGLSRLCCTSVTKNDSKLLQTEQVAYASSSCCGQGGTRCC